MVTACDNCGTRYNVAEANAGKTARCRKCGSTFTIRNADDDAPLYVPPTEKQVDRAFLKKRDVNSGDDTGLTDKLPAPHRPETTESPDKPPAAHKPVSVEKKSASDWDTGDVIMGLYEVLGLLGEGGMGKVYRVLHLGWNVELAVKNPKPEELAKVGGAENFQREAETWVNLGLHPHIVSCYYVREFNGNPLVFAEYIEGGSLNDWIADGKLTEIDRILDVAIQFAWGLQYAHEKGLIHQDVKPANVMLTLDGVAKVTDFGLSHALGRENESPMFDAESVRSSVGMTQAFCSPEQANGEDLTIKTDIWSWSVSILSIFTGEVTWLSGAIAGEALEWYLKYESIDGNRPQIPGAVVNLLRRCFKENLFERPRDMSEIAGTLIEIYKELTGNVYPRHAPLVSSSTADSLNNRAVSLLDLGRIDEAFRLWKDAVRIEPHHPESTYNLGLIEWRTGQIVDTDIVSQLEEVERSHAEGWSSSYMLGLVHLERDDSDSAMKIFGGLLNRYPAVEEIKTAYRLAQERSIPGRRFLKTFSGHEGPVTGVGISHDGRLAISGSMDMALKLWDTVSGKCIHTFIGHTGGVLAVYLNPNGRYAMSGSADKTVKIWDCSTGYCLNTFKGHVDDVISVFMNRIVDNPLSGGRDETVKLWDRASGHYLRSFVGHKGAVTGVQMNKDGTVVFSCSADGSIRQWDVTTLRSLHTYRGHSGPVNSIVLSSRDGEVLLSGGSDKTINLWDVKKNRLIRTLTGHADSVQSVALNWGGNVGLSASLDKTIKQWSLNTGQCCRTYEGHTDGATCVALSLDGRFAVSGGNDSMVNLWQVDCNNGFYRAPMMLSHVSKSEAALTAMGVYAREVTLAREALSAGDFAKAAGHLRKARQQKGYSRGEESVSLWRKLYGRFPHSTLNGAWEEATLKEHEGPVRAISLDASGDYLLSCGADKTIKLWSISQRQCVRTLKGHGGVVLTSVIRQDGMVALSGSADTTVRLWDLSRGKELLVLRGHSAPVRSVALSVDGHLALSGSEDNSLKVWDLSSGRCLRTFEGHESAVTSVALSPDGRFALSGGADFSIKQWEMTTVYFQGVLGSFEGHSGTVGSLSVSLDAALAFSGSADSRVILWDLSTGQSLWDVKGHFDEVTSVYFSYDRRFALSGSLDNAFRIWDVATGNCIRVFKGHVLGVTAVCLSRDGGLAVSASDDGTIKLWALDWELDTETVADWDEKVKPYLEIFLTNHTPYLPGSLARRGKPSWKSADFDDLVQILGCAGFGCLNPERVEKELVRLGRLRVKK
ncbi:MAG: protein kinase [Nitrospirae bacterium]|nr:protein kinase [Nitrospirota bacterium]